MPSSGHHCYEQVCRSQAWRGLSARSTEDRTRLDVSTNGISTAVFRVVTEDASEGDPMPRFAECDRRTPELVVSGTQVPFSSMALLSAGSVIWVLFQRLLFSQ